MGMGRKNSIEAGGTKVKSEWPWVFEQLGVKAVRKIQKQVYQPKKSVLIKQVVFF